MSRFVRFAMSVAAIAFVAHLSVSLAADEEKPKFTIKEVMDKAHKGRPSLYKKFVKGETTDDEAKSLLEMYEALALNTPPKGEAKDWKDKVASMVSAVKDKDREGLEKAASCQGCHSAHKK